jgi:NAD(P)-dependent dehydrogenase (short-subunit alcohol dehydrogenase family)
MVRLLHGQHLIISGGLGDIGRAVTLLLAAQGAAVTLSDLRSQAEAEPHVAALRAHHIAARYDQVDVSDAEAVERWVNAVADGALGPPSLVVPNAAVVTVQPVLELSLDRWSRELSINLTGAFALAQAAARRLVQTRRSGRIVFIGSWAGHRPHRSLTAYCVAKAGLRMLMRQFALELADHDILVNEVAPGYVDAGLSGQLFARNHGARNRSIAQVPVHRLSEAADVAREVLHFCDPATRYHTGAVSLMDGGLSLLSGANP